MPEGHVDHEAHAGRSEPRLHPGEARLQRDQHFHPQGQLRAAAARGLHLHRHTVPELPDSFEEISRNYKFNSCAVVGSSGT